MALSGLFTFKRSAWVITFTVTLLCTIICAGFPAIAAESGVSMSSLKVGAYYYPWYDNARFGRDRHWSQGYIQEPSLGRYSNLDPAVIGSHIGWAKSAGIDFFVASWWGPQDFTDSVLLQNYLRHPSAKDVPIALFYEVKTRFKDARIDFNDPTNRTYLVRDFEYMAKTYFHNPAYLKLNGKPVVFIYLTRTFTGDYSTAIREVRKAVSALGYEIFLVGDEVYHGRPAMERAQVFDAVTAYNMHSSNMPEDDWNTLVNRTASAYMTWKTSLAGLSQPIFFPNAMPGFNDWGVRPQEKHPRFYPSPERFRDSIELALEYLDPRLPILMITSFNEWHEDTQIEPSLKYGELYLKTLSETLASFKK